MRAFTDMAEVDRDITAAVKTLRERLYFPDGSEQELALCAIETFIAIALKVMVKTNPSKVRDCARTIEIKARMDGVPIMKGLQ
jgi:hypothetical protein